MMKIKKEKNEHSLLSNMLFFVGLMFKASPLLVIGELCWGILMNVPSRLISVIGVKYIIDVMTSGERVYRIFWAVGIIAAVIVLSRVISWLFREFFWNVEKEKCYFALNKELYEKAKSLDLESYDNPEFYNSFILTIESSSDNIQNLLGLIRNYFGNVVALISSLARVTEGKTVIYISHRLSSATLADRIIVLDGGRIIESGTHGELMALGGKYSEMFSLQASNYSSEEAENDEN